jgi:hypothetical protein
MIRLALVGLLLLPLTGCERVERLVNEPARQSEKLQKENRQLRTQVEKLSKQLAQAEAERVVNQVLVSLYDLRHALEKYALKNQGHYPFANNINDLQTTLKSFLPENFVIEAVYLEKVRSQQTGYIMIANVKGREIVVSNLL